MQTIKALTFDLDDTLWPVAPVIENAERVAFEWLARTYPSVTAAFGQEELRQLRFEIMNSHPEIKHDLISQCAECRIALCGYPGRP